jgi:periplasmic protein TonB
MFQILAGERKRRVISPTTIAASVAAHVLLLGGALYAAAGDGGDTGEARADTTIVWTADDPPPPDPVEPQPPPPLPDQPDQPPTPGDVLQLSTPTVVPDGVTEEAPNVLPIDPKAYTGDGRIGDIIGPPTGGPTEPTGNTDPPSGGGEYVPDEYSVEERPVLNRDGLSQALERNYPAVLRASRVSGRVVIEVIVDEDGRVRDGSARGLDASHPAFGEAVLRAVDRFRFRPGRMAGVPVPVRVTIPIQWTVPN